MIALYIAIGLGVLFLIWMFLIAPSAGRRAKRAAVLYGDVAHRGFFDNNAGIPENSMAAFRRALERGYGIETDVHLSADGICVLHHDDTLSRICGQEGYLRDRTAEELTRTHLLGTEETVPLFGDFLRLVAGRVPLVIELKAERGNHAALVDAVLKELEGYDGPFSIESFDPRVLRVLRRRAPHVVRGQLSGRIKSGTKLGKITDFLLRNLLLNFLTRPDYIAYSYRDRDILSFRLATSLLGGRRVYWTIRNREEYDDVLRQGALPIFEGFEV